MIYATQADIVSVFGEREVIMLTDRSLLGTIDATVLADAMSLASDEIDAYLDGRYALPLPNVPRLLTQICCDITRYRLSGGAAQETEPARNRYKDSIKMLESIKRGDLTLGLDPAQQEVPTRGAVQISNGNRTFSRTTLADY
ncbi:MAG: gp436 family protein [Sulfuriferula sp.]